MLPASSSQWRARNAAAARRFVALRVKSPYQKIAAEFDQVAA
jgi:hypothetical protein